MIKNWSSVYVDLRRIVDYYEQTYIGQIGNAGIIKSLYKREFWNVYLRVQSNIDRTTNCAESWHRVLNFRAHVPHPNIAQFVSEILGKDEKTRLT